MTDAVNYNHLWIKGGNTMTVLIILSCVFIPIMSICGIIIGLKKRDEAVRNGTIKHKQNVFAIIGFIVSVIVIIVSMAVTL